MGYSEIAVENTTNGRCYIEVRVPESGVVDLYVEDDGDEACTVSMSLDEVCRLIACLSDAMREALG